ncbi:MAG TPA: ATP-grasp domain-containing protein [Anaerolineales bacterium]|nr:ATP-grasp domain-containing protein [Anaerolineales bacterium]
MNFVFLSPHFPPNYYRFAVALKNHGVNVLGLADENYDSLRPELKSSLTEYFRVNNMNNYDELVRALGYFTHRYGKLDRVDSHNEYWLETEAHMRTDFNMFGIRSDQIERVKRKSRMRETFIQAGIKVARGRVVKSMEDAQELIVETGYPLVAKPDIGVGAAATYKIHNEDELKSFFETKPPVDYLFEEFVSGQIVTFDGLTDRDGTPVFKNSLAYSAGVMETVLNDDLIYYYTLREIPADLEALGCRVLAAFDVRERFFHFEFFRENNTGDLLALEVNMRPPGGLTTDMFNYSCDIDIYNAWASIIAGKGFPYPDYTHKYYCCYASRKSNRSYAHSEQEILAAYGDRVRHHEQINGVFSAALGNYGYLVRSPDLDEIISIAKFIQE